ncbi:MAG TPA: hypothetical protein VK633_05750, partial [Verrucomicrobiae bacterium]|nr:hypothetical protein [Verrucomicrobiae bacterium]
IGGTNIVGGLWMVPEARSFVIPFQCLPTVTDGSQPEQSTAKPSLVEGTGQGYLKTVGVGDYEYLNPARGSILPSDERLFANLWSSLPWYLTASEHRPCWLRTERLLGAHGIRSDSAGRRRPARVCHAETEDEAFRKLRALVREEVEELLQTGEELPPVGTLPIVRLCRPDTAPGTLGL